MTKYQRYYKHCKFQNVVIFRLVVVVFLSIYANLASTTAMHTYHINMYRYSSCIYILIRYFGIARLVMKLRAHKKFQILVCTITITYIDVYKMQSLNVRKPANYQCLFQFGHFFQQEFNKSAKLKTTSCYEFVK